MEHFEGRDPSAPFLRAGEPVTAPGQGVGAAARGENSPPPEPEPKPKPKPEEGEETSASKDHGWDWLFENQPTASERPTKPTRSSRGKGKTISLNMPLETLERIQRLAERKGLGYQTYLKVLLHEALEQEERFYPPRK